MQTTFFNSGFNRDEKMELLGLQWGDIGNNHNQIYVKRSMWEGQFSSPHQTNKQEAARINKMG